MPGSRTAPFTDTVIDDESPETELDDWDAGQFMQLGETLAVEWLSPDESRERATAEVDL